VPVALAEACQEVGDDLELRLVVAREEPYQPLRLRGVQGCDLPLDAGGVKRHHHLAAIAGVTASACIARCLQAVQDTGNGAGAEAGQVGEPPGRSADRAARAG